MWGIAAVERPCIFARGPTRVILGIRAPCATGRHFAYLLRLGRDSRRRHFGVMGETGTFPLPDFASDCATKPEAFASSMNSRRYPMPASRPFRTANVCSTTRNRPSSMQSVRRFRRHVEALRHMGWVTETSYRRAEGEEAGHRREVVGLYRMAGPGVVGIAQCQRCRTKTGAQTERRQPLSAARLAIPSGENDDRWSTPA